MNTQNYTIILDILLRSKSSACDQACIDQSQKNSAIPNVVLKSESGAAVTTNVLTPFNEVGSMIQSFVIDAVWLCFLSIEEPITTPPPPRTGKFIDSSFDVWFHLLFHIGESSPGLAARLGMGLGISFLGVLLIGEIAFFVWKSRSGKSHRSAAYANTT